MATYTHYGKQPDVLKHLILCEVLRNEHPQIYVETNSACAFYPMQQTSEQQYGIYYFLEKAAEEIENLYGRETQLSEEIRKSLDS